MDLEGAHGPLGEPYGAAAGVLGLGEPESASTPDPLQLKVDPERTPIQIYVSPAERERFALPEPAHQAQDVQCLKAIALGSFQKRGGLRGVEGLWLL